MMSLLLCERPDGHRAAFLTALQRPALAACVLAGSGQAGVRQGPTGTKAALKRAGIGALAGNTINFPVRSQRSIGREGRPRYRDSRIMPCLGAKIIGLLINARHDCIMTRQLSPFPKL
ncbi:unnamed protein product [Calypogeia fissa]